MKLVAVTSFKSRLSEYLKCVEQGQVLLITDHDRPVAEVHRASVATQDAQWQHLCRLGVLRAPQNLLDLAELDGHMLPRGGRGLTEAILEEREER